MHECMDRERGWSVYKESLVATDDDIEMEPCISLPVQKSISQSRDGNQAHFSVHYSLYYLVTLEETLGGY